LFPNVNASRLLGETAILFYLCNVYMGGQNPLVPALDAEPQKSKPYQSDVYMTGFNAIPRQAREQDSFDTPPYMSC